MRWGGGLSGHETRHKKREDGPVSCHQYPCGDGQIAQQGQSSLEGPFLSMTDNFFTTLCIGLFVL